MRFLGQTFGADLIEGIRSAISTGLETTRSGLSRRVCEWLDWRSVNGHLREIDARKADNPICLPAASQLLGGMAPYHPGDRCSCVGTARQANPLPTREIYGIIPGLSERGR